MKRNINRSAIAVTGATGFIGGSICIELKKRGYTVVGIDRVTRPHLMPYIDKFLCNDFLDIALSNYECLDKCNTIIHCAGTSLVGPSSLDPATYYFNNVAKTISLLEWCTRSNKHFIFSS
jgi:UDP-glucose 4-epimerase